VNHGFFEVAFWVAAAVVIYVYVGYPLLLACWSRFRAAVPLAERAHGLPPGGNGVLRELEPRPAPAGDSLLPTVSIILAVRNEGARLAARLDNLLTLDYPERRREVIVVSDGSTDETPQVLARYRGLVRALAIPASGKAAALNAGVAAARHDILAFADARQVFAPDALRRLVEPFADARVAGVSGELLIDDADSPPGTGTSDASPVAEGVGLYWRYEKWLRQRESEVGSMLGATGAVWALRRRAWRPLPPETLLDDVLAPMRAVLDGSRVVFAPGALAFDRSSPDAATERRRKVRTLAGNYQLVLLEPRLLLPVVNPVWLQFVSHKLGRLVVPYALVALLWASAVLAGDGVVYSAALVAQVAFYVLAAHGAIVSLADGRAPATPAVAETRQAKEFVNAQVD
jgi:poly-beta-1,6-N-acetyl-D-glucosamine synthase